MLQTWSCERPILVTHKLRADVNNGVLIKLSDFLKLGLSRDHVRNMENQGFPGSESSQLNLIKLTYSPSCLPTIDLFLYCIDVRVHDSGHSYSNIDITIFRDHEPIRVEHTVTRCVALDPSIN